jgi:transposase
MAKTKQTLPQIHPHAAGIDIGSESIFTSVRQGQVRQFDTFTASLEQARDYLLEEGITTVAMEATGVYWVALYELLEAAGIEVLVVNGAHVKNVPGRKSDVLDCQWIQQLHSHGLLRGSFIPDEAMRRLRTYVRLRDDHIEMAASHIQHMQKALDLMNIKLHKVISQIHGVSGIRVMEAILAGERDPESLADLCDVRILNKKRDRVAASLKGSYKEEHLFALGQALTAWRFYQEQIRACDKQIERHLEEITAEIEPPATLSKPKPIRHNKPAVKDLHLKMVKLTGGRDVSQLCGFTDLTLMKVIAEVGTEMSAWKTEKHFTAWLGLAPGSHQSGKSRKRRRKRVHSRAGQIFRESAQSVGQSKHLALGGFYRRIKARRGAPIAVVATARKLAILFYKMMKYGIEYVETGLEQYKKQQEEQRMKYLKKQAFKLGFELVAVP